MKRSIVFRVDPRLVHATLTSAWLPALGLEWIVVADATVFASPRLRNIYEMSAMDSADLEFVEEKALAHHLSSVERTRPGVVLFSSLDGALVAAGAGAKIDRLLISHLPDANGRDEVQPGVHLGPQERATIRQLRGHGVEVTIQPLPDDPPVDPGPVTTTGPLEAELEVVNERGLHLRAAHAFSEAIGGLPDEVRVGVGSNLVNAKSLLGLTTLGAARGTRLRVVVEGPSAAATLERIRELFASGFNEGRPGSGAGP